MAYLLDTNICIYIIKRKPLSVLEKFEQLHTGDVYMSVVTLGELLYGAQRSQNPERAIQVIEGMTRYIPTLSCCEETARHYADIRADLSRKGRIIGNNDLWIAAQARALDYTLVTNNLREFQHVNGLKLENWVR